MAAAIATCIGTGPCLGADPAVAQPGIAQPAVAQPGIAQDVPPLGPRTYHVLKDTFACQNPRAVRALTDPDTARPQDREWVNFFVSEGKCVRVNTTSDWEKLSADGDLALMLNHAHKSSIPLFFRFDTLDEGHDPSAAPDAAPAPVSTAYTDGQAARRAWDEWFNTQQGEARDGAQAWAQQWAAPEPGICWNSNRHSLTKDWQGGCLAARAHAVASDVRRRSEPEYAAGWNAPNADAPAGPVPQDDPAAVAVKAEIDRARQEATERKAAAFRAGQVDRRKWDEWFSGFLGDYRAGAAYWFSQMGKHPAGTCADATQSDTWRDGCGMAKRRLAGPEERRAWDALYAKGWDSVASAAVTP